MPSLDNVFTERYWEGEPGTGEGITHAVAVDPVDGDRIAACGRFVDREYDFSAPATQTVTCLRCWYRGLRYPNLIRWR